jgi:hypothetical protein
MDIWDTNYNGIFTLKCFYLHVLTLFFLLFVLVFDVLPKLALVVVLPDVIGGDVESSFKFEVGDGDGQDEGGRPLGHALVQCSDEAHGDEGRDVLEIGL